jgi:hypothetical protein
MIQMVDHLPIKCEALNSNINITPVSKETTSILLKQSIKKESQKWTKDCILSMSFLDKESIIFNIERARRNQEKKKTNK